MGFLGAIPNLCQRDDGPNTMGDGINHSGALATTGCATRDSYRVDFHAVAAACQLTQCGDVLNPELPISLLKRLKSRWPVLLFSQPLLLHLTVDSMMARPISSR